MQAPDLPAFRVTVRERLATARNAPPKPGYPFCMVDDGGRRVDAMQQLRGTLTGLATILLAVAAGIVAIFTVGVVLWILLTLAAVGALLWLLHNRTMRRVGEAWRAAADAHPAALVMAHNSVMEPGHSIVPGAMLVDFGDRPNAARLRQAAERLFHLTDHSELPPHHRVVRDWIETEMQRARFGRIRAPSDIAGNDTTWLISLRCDRDMMQNGYLDRTLCFVMARCDRDESAEMLPHRLWIDGMPEDED